MLPSVTTLAFLKTLEKVHHGSLHLTLPDGKTYTFQGKSPASASGVKAHMRIVSPRCIPKIAWRGSLGLGDAFVENLWTTPDLPACLEFFAQNISIFRRDYTHGTILSRFTTRARYALQRNTLDGSQRNIEAHYDLGNDFYKQWLDKTMSYSSALFSNDHDRLTLCKAQENKLDRIIARIGKNASILEIGCGWGSFIQRAVSAGHRAFGITLSHEQARWAQDKARPFGKDARIAIQDYRKTEGRYDAIVSIEMYEAVGEAYWREYFAKIAQSLKKNGTAVIQAITIAERSFENYRRGTDFMRSYIFPGGMLASKERFRQEAQAAGLQVADFFSFGKSYAKTLEIWLDDFNAAWQNIAQLGFDERFARIWQYYLAGCRAAFLAGITDVSQIELRHAR